MDDPGGDEPEKVESVPSCTFLMMLMLIMMIVVGLCFLLQLAATYRVGQQRSQWRVLVDMV